MHRREVSPPTLMVSVAFVPVKWLLRLMRHHRGGHFQGSPSRNQSCTEAATEAIVIKFPKPTSGRLRRSGIGNG